jgi:hypothetical protein
MVEGIARAAVRRHTASFRNEDEGSGDLVGGREADYLLLFPSRMAFGDASSAAKKNDVHSNWGAGHEGIFYQ